MDGWNLEALTAVQVAKLLGVTDRAVRKWVSEKELPTNSAAGVMTMRWAAVLPWYVKMQSEAFGTPRTSGKLPPVGEDSESYEDALARKTRAEANLKELQLAKERGQVAAIADVERVLASSIKATQTQIQALPSRLAPRMLGIEAHGAAVAIVESETRTLLSNLATIDAVREAAGASAGEEDE